MDNTKSVLENKSVTCITDKERNDTKLVDTCNFNARNVNQNIPLLNTNCIQDACICTNNTVVNIDLNESTDIVETVYNESVSENESTCSESIDTNNLNILCLNCCGLKKRARYPEFENFYANTTSYVYKKQKRMILIKLIYPGIFLN